MTETIETCKREDSYAPVSIGHRGLIANVTGFARDRLLKVVEKREMARSLNYKVIIRLDNKVC